MKRHKKKPTGTDAIGGCIWKIHPKDELATIEFNSRLQQNPHDSAAWCGLGNLLHEKGDSVGAISHWHKAWACKNDGFEATEMYEKLAKHHYDLWVASDQEPPLIHEPARTSGILTRDGAELITCIRAWEEVITIMEKRDEEVKLQGLRHGTTTPAQVSDARQQIQFMMSCLYFESGDMEHAGEMLGRLIASAVPDSGRYWELVRTAAGLMSFVGMEKGALQYMEYCLEHSPSIEQPVNDCSPQYMTHRVGYTQLDVMLQLALIHEAVQHQEKRRGKDKRENAVNRRKLRTNKAEEVNKAELAFQEVFRLLNDMGAGGSVRSSSNDQSNKHTPLGEVYTTGKQSTVQHCSPISDQRQGIIGLTEHRKWGKHQWYEWSEAANTWGEVGDRFVSLVRARPRHVMDASDCTKLKTDLAVGDSTSWDSDKVSDLSLTHVYSVGGGILLLPAIQAYTKAAVCALRERKRAISQEAAAGHRPRRMGLNNRLAENILAPGMAILLANESTGVMLVRQAYCHRRLRNVERAEELCRKALALAPFSAEVTKFCVQWYPTRFRKEVDRVAKAVTRIQAIIRGHQSHGRVRKQRLIRKKYDPPATLIQSRMRGQLARKKTHALRRRGWAALKLTSMARGFRVRTLALKALQRQAAACKIQAVTRGYGYRVKAQRIRYHSAVEIQRMARGMRGRNLVLLKLRKVIPPILQLQGWTRQFIHRQRWSRLKSGLLDVQRFLRGSVCRYKLRRNPTRKKWKRYGIDGHEPRLDGGGGSRNASKFVQKIKNETGTSNQMDAWDKQSDFMFRCRTSYVSCSRDTGGALANLSPGGEWIGKRSHWIPLCVAANDEFDEMLGGDVLVVATSLFSKWDAHRFRFRLTDPRCIRRRRSTIHTLLLSGCPWLGNDGLSVVVDAVASSGMIVCLSLVGVGLMAEGTKHIASRCFGAGKQECSCNLVKLVLDDNPLIGDEGVIYIAHALSGELKDDRDGSINTSSSLSDVAKDTNAEIQSTANTADTVERTFTYPRLTQLHLNCVGCSDFGAEAIANVLSDSVPSGSRYRSLQPISFGHQRLHSRIQLNELGLARNRIGDLGLQSIAAALVSVADGISSAILSTGDEYNTKISMGRQRAIQEYRCKNNEPTAMICSQLKLLWLGDNPQIGDAGARMFSEALQHCHCPLRILDLSGNAIGDNGAVAIAAALRAGQYPLHKFKFDRNRLTEVGARALAAVKSQHVQVALKTGLKPTFEHLQLNEMRKGDRQDIRNRLPAIIV